MDEDQLIKQSRYIMNTMIDECDNLIELQSNSIFRMQNSENYNVKMLCMKKLKEYV
jgi:hypothetical protein